MSDHVGDRLLRSTLEENVELQQLRTHVAIIGGGPGGICMAIALRRAGIDDFLLLEQAPSIGGTWFHNNYPGSACDVPSHLYSFSFEQKHDWSRTYADRNEILKYLQDLVAKYNLESHVHLNCRIRAAHWNDACSKWQLRTGRGDIIDADVVISAIGLMNEPYLPDIPGLAEFSGTTFHTARWNPSHGLTGANVAIIGTAASSIQVVPEIATQCRHLSVFQRSAQWILPKLDDQSTEEETTSPPNDPEEGKRRRAATFQQLEEAMTFADELLLRNCEEAGLANIAIAHDPDTRRKLTPSTPFGCQRPLISNNYYPVFNRDNVELVTEPIQRITPTSIIASDGTERTVDTIIFATGFQTTKYLQSISITGRGGVPLEDVWVEGAMAYLGIAVSEFPNLFMIYGPNTNNGSILFMIECQVDYVVQLLDWIHRDQLSWINIRKQEMDCYNDELQKDISAVKVWQGGCHNYYRAPSGRVVTQWPHTMSEYRFRTLHVDKKSFETRLRHG